LLFSSTEPEVVYVSRSDVTNPLAAWSQHGFELDGTQWPSVEHYYQGMKFENPDLRDAIRAAPHPKEARDMARKNKRQVRKHWKSLRRTHMIRAVYLKCRTHPEAGETLLATGSAKIVETSQYDYFWGCGRDGRGENNYGRVLMDVRGKLRELSEAD